MTQCRADAACPFPALPGYRLCRQHQYDTELTFTMHEMSCENRVYGDEFINKGFRVQSIAGGVTWNKKLRFNNPQKRGPKPKMPVEPLPAPARYRMPDEREAVTHKFKVDGVRCYATIGLYPDGSPGELFLRTDKQGSFEHAMVDAWAILFSMLLQHNVPLPAILNKFKHSKFEPRGVTSSTVKELKFADSILDYLVRWMEMKFLGVKTPPEPGEVEAAIKEEPELNSIEAAKCPHGFGSTGNCPTCRTLITKENK